jgi:hypothetical protein
VCPLLRLLYIICEIVIIYLIIYLIKFLIIVINLFWNQLFAIIGRDGHPFHASGRQHMIAARTGPRLSSVWPIWVEDPDQREPVNIIQ